MPVGWGTVPAAEIFECLPDYRGVVTLGLCSRNYTYAGEALLQASTLLKENEQAVKI